MPELPELEALAEGLTAALAGRAIEDLRVHHPAVLRTAEPAPGALAGGVVASVWRRGKVLCVATAAGGPVLVMHLMQGGRLVLVDGSTGRRPPRGALLDLAVAGAGILRLREYGTRRRASAHILHAGALAAHPPLARLGPEAVGLDPAG
ncbi:MAG: DNA-formamidopyrimidine glycosylase family protein, partial [Miltoncostaeaceae bacterium]